MTEEELSKLIAQGLIYYEREEKDLDMLLFPEMLENVTHIDRTLSSFQWPPRVGPLRTTLSAGV